MTIHDLQDLDRDDVLGWLGLTKKSSKGASLARALGLFGAGVVAGTAVALLFAPKTGAGLREDLRNRLRRGGDSLDVPTSATVTREDTPSGLQG